MDIAYFEEAVDYLMDLDVIKSDKGIGVCGISKGAEVCLAMASSLPKSKLGAIVCLNALLSYSMVDVMYKGSKVCDGKFNFDRKGALEKLAGNQLMPSLPRAL